MGYVLTRWLGLSAYEEKKRDFLNKKRSKLKVNADKRWNIPNPWKN